MYCNMTPPDSSIIPQVMVGIVVVDSDSYLRLSFHVLVVFSHLVMACLSWESRGFRFWRGYLPLLLSTLLAESDAVFVFFVHLNFRLLRVK